ncbi:hypothetical protein [Marinobacter sp. HL-58]|uniref:hypothetical protein n=1 Tax=Marinobacter sp. HL-58 TaxID=1479237 RepID=UPI000484BB07|nr:hypothetical protein [Marinobacter sp. HL-58]KPQ01249.1 MAG: hypothetical protein HLUCCO03_17385 [Marinobacter sp. HL-58]
MNWGDIIKGLDKNLIPALKIIAFSIFGSSIIVFMTADYLNNSFGKWPYNLEQFSIISFLLSGFVLIFVYLPSATKFAQNYLDNKRIENAIKNLDVLEEQILFTMSLNPEKPLKISNYCKHEAPQTNTTAEIYSAIVDLKRKKLVKPDSNEDNLVFLTDQGIKKSIEIQKNTLR